MSKSALFLLIIILLVAGFTRLYRIDNPIADWHSWRQADTSAVSRNFVKSGFDLLRPRFDDLSSIPSGKDNPQGYRFVEFPLYNATVAWAFIHFNRFTLEVWGRLISILSSLGSLIFLFLLTKKYLGIRIGFLTAFFFSLLPYNIYYSRTILPDSSTVMAILGGTYFFDLAIEKEFQISNFKFQIKQWLFFVLAIVFTISAFLLKPFSLFLTLPMIYLAFERWGLGFVKKWQLWLFALLTIMPLVFWRIWMQQFPEGIPASAWLFNEANIRFKGAFFYWIFADRIGRLILGYWGVALLVLGIIKKINQKEGFFFYTFLVSSLFYLVVIAGGNVKHDYYQILIIPTLSIFLAKGADMFLIASKTYFSKTISYLLLALCLLFMFSFSWYHVRDYFNINNPLIVEAGQVVDKLTPKDAKVIAAYRGDTAFLYQTNRQGWPIVTNPIPVMIQKGATHLVIINPDQPALNLAKDYKTMIKTERYILFDLQEKP